MKKDAPKELYFNSYEVDTRLTIPREEELKIRVINVIGIGVNGEKIKLIKTTEEDLMLEDYLDLENRLIRLLFITLTDIFHANPKLKKHIYVIPPYIRKIIEVIEVRRENQREKTIRYELIYNVSTTISLVKILKSNKTPPLSHF